MAYTSFLPYKVQVSKDTVSIVFDGHLHDTVPFNPNKLNIDGEHITYAGKQLFVQSPKYARKRMRFFPKHNLYMLKGMYNCDVTDIMVPHFKTDDICFNGFVNILQAIKNTIIKHTKFKLYESPRVKLNRMLEAPPKIIQDGKTTIVDNQIADDDDLYRLEVMPKICTIDDKDIFAFRVSTLYEYQFVNPFDDLLDDLYDNSNTPEYDNPCLRRVDIDPVEADQ